MENEYRRELLDIIMAPATCQHCRAVAILEFTMTQPEELRPAVLRDVLAFKDFPTDSFLPPIKASSHEGIGSDTSGPFLEAPPKDASAEECVTLLIRRILEVKKERGLVRAALFLTVVLLKPTGPIISDGSKEEIELPEYDLVAAAFRANPDLFLRLQVFAICGNPNTGTMARWIMTSGGTDAEKEAMICWALSYLMEPVRVMEIRIPASRGRSRGGVFRALRERILS